MRPEIKLVPFDYSNKDHFLIMYRVRTDESVDKWLKGNPPTDLISHSKYLDSQKNKKKFFIIQTGTIEIGYCQITITDSEQELGWAIEGKFQGLGYGAEAVRLLIEEAQRFSDKKVILYVKEDNTRAINLYKKFKFRTTKIHSPVIKMEL